MHASNSSWKHLPPPPEREQLNFEAVYTDAEVELLTRGLVPNGMDEKWFIYYEGDWLRFHRSWTGAYIYALKLDSSPLGTRVADSWVNRNPLQYKATDTAYDRRLVKFLIDAFLLKKSDVKFPMPTDASSAPPGAVQHNLVGRGYPESNQDDA